MRRSPRSRTPRRIFTPLAFTFLVASLVGLPHVAWATSDPPGPILDQEVLAEAEPDTCFDVIGGPRPTPPCTAPFRDKFNHQYVWSGARSGDFAYWGTGINIHCGLQSLTTIPIQPWQSPAGAPATVCEQALGASAQRLTPLFGDTVAAKVFRANVVTGEVEEVTPQDAATQSALADTLGLRGGGANDDVVFLVGQQIQQGTGRIAGMLFLAFEGSTGQYLGMTLRSEIRNLRDEGAVLDGELYFGAALRDPVTFRNAGGTVLKWTGDKADPFQFEIVGRFSDETGYISAHKGRLVVAGWPNQTGRSAVGPTFTGPSHVRLSPKAPPGGLTSADANSWQSIFNWPQYDPDPISETVLYLGAIESFQGSLYFGSYNGFGVFSTSGQLWNTVGRPESDLGKIVDLLNSSRAATVFEIKNAGKSNQKVSVLYGETTLPVFDQATGRWTVRPNDLHQVPRLGPSGFNGNTQQMYNWTYTVLQNRLYMATFDASGVVPTTVPLAAQVFELSPLTQALLTALGTISLAGNGGGDLWRLDSPNSPAVAEDLSGYGDRLNYGIRIMIPFEDKGFFLGGTAGATNLEKGWQMIKFTPGNPRLPLPNPPNIPLPAPAF